MSSVARGLLLPILDWARANGHPCADVFDGLETDETALRGPVRRLSWADYLALHERMARAVGGVEQLGALIETVPSPTVDWLLGSLDSPAKLYRAWSHLSPLLWGGIRLDLEEDSDGRLRVAVAVPAGVPDATVWFRSSQGFLASLPRRIGLPRADLEVGSVGPQRAEWLLRPTAGEVTRPPGHPALDFVAEVTEGYGAALRELEEYRRKAAEPPRDLEERVRTAASAWQLTPAQAQVLKGVVRGLSNKEIASELGNAEATVEVHVTRLLRKAGAPGRTALVTRFWGGPG